MKCVEFECNRDVVEVILVLSRQRVTVDARPHETGTIVVDRITEPVGEWEKATELEGRDLEEARRLALNLYRRHTCA